MCFAEYPLSRLSIISKIQVSARLIEIVRSTAFRFDISCFLNRDGAPSLSLAEIDRYFGGSGIWARSSTNPAEVFMWQSRTSVSLSPCSLSIAIQHAVSDTWSKRGIRWIANEFPKRRNDFSLTNREIPS